MDQAKAMTENFLAKDQEKAEEKLNKYLKAYAKHAKMTETEAWELLLAIRAYADDDMLLGYAGSRFVLEVVLGRVA